MVVDIVVNIAVNRVVMPEVVVRGVVVMVVVVLVPVVPQLGLVEKKEKHQPDQQRHEQILGPNLALEGFGQQVHEGGGQQCASGQAEHVPGGARQNAETQRRGQPHAADAGGQCSQQNRYQQHGLIGYCSGMRDKNHRPIKKPPLEAVFTEALSHRPQLFHVAGG